jgi:hypothetical protein
MNKTEGFRRIGLFLGTLSSVMWTGYVAWNLIPLAEPNSAFEWLVFLIFWAIGLLVTFFAPVGLVTGIGWVVSGFQKSGGED